MTDLVNRRPPGFDYAFRPASYFNQLDRGTLILSSILGEERRKDVEQRLASGDYDPAVWGEWLTESRLDEETRRQLGRAHPAFMGGEYLPPLEEEIEIARIVLASVTQDVCSIRARRCENGIAYRVVDEYETQFKPSMERSAEPLTMEELIDLINRTEHEGDEVSGGLALSHVVWHCEQGMEEGMRGFVTVESGFYPEVRQYFDTVLEGYLDEVDAANCA